jgi:hypothetical protein
LGREDVGDAYSIAMMFDPRLKDYLLPNTLNEKNYVKRMEQLALKRFGNVDDYRADREKREKENGNPDPALASAQQKASVTR